MPSTLMRQRPVPIGQDVPGGVLQTVAEQTAPPSMQTLRSNVPTQSSDARWSPGLSRSAARLRILDARGL
jgi:hypothetical protein